MIVWSHITLVVLTNCIIAMFMTQWWKNVIHTVASPGILWLKCCQTDKVSHFLQYWDFPKVPIIFAQNLFLIFAKRLNTVSLIQKRPLAPSIALSEIYRYLPKAFHFNIVYAGSFLSWNCKWQNGRQTFLLIEL